MTRAFTLIELLRGFHHSLYYLLFIEDGRKKTSTSGRNKRSNPDPLHWQGNLFEYTDGIYTSGAIFDQWRIDNPNGNQPDRPDFSNFGDGPQSGGRDGVK